MIEKGKKNKKEKLGKIRKLISGSDLSKLESLMRRFWANNYLKESRQENCTIYMNAQPLDTN